MDRSIVLEKLDALNKRMLIDQLVDIKSSTQLEKRLAEELEATDSICYTISDSFPTGFILQCKIKHLNIKINDFYIYRFPPKAFTINVPANGCRTSNIFQIIFASIRSD